MNDMQYLNRYYRERAPYGVKVEDLHKLQRKYDTNYRHSFEQRGYLREYWGSIYARYTRDYYRLWTR